MNLVLIPFYGASGAVIGTFGAELMVCAYQILHIRDVYKFRQLFQALLPFMLCGLLEFAAVYPLITLSIEPFPKLLLQVLVGGTVYLVSCGIYIIGIKKEYQNVGDIFKSFKQ